MTTEVQVRDAIVAYLNPAWALTYPTIKLFYENAVKVDLDAVGSSFLRVMIEFTDSVRQGIDLAPYTATYDEVLACDKEAFNQFFHAMLDAGHYFAPSAFEAGFVSAAHTDTDIAATVAAADAYFATLK